MPPERPIPDGLSPFWSGTVEQFADLPTAPLKPEEQERHRIYSMLLLSMICRKWNGNKYGPIGDYGTWRAKQKVGCVDDQNMYCGGSYLGHNIAALAVDGEGRIIDFDFNHNQVFASTVEHAESRLVRRVFALNQIYDPWLALDRAPSTPSAEEGARHALRPAARRSLYATSSGSQPKAPRREAERGVASPTAPAPYVSILDDVTIYTSLESCAQCSGIMCLGSVKEIVYLQWDQGQFLIGNMMWQATTAQKFGFIAPRPIRGDEIGLDYFAKLNDANEVFGELVKDKPFYSGPGSPAPVSSPSITSFLCTDLAYSIYREAEVAFCDWDDVKFPKHSPNDHALTNQEVLVEAKDFLDWVSKLEGRGAPHRV